MKEKFNYTEFLASPAISYGLALEFILVSLKMIL